MYDRNEREKTMDKAICIVCGEEKEVCCDYQTLEDGTHIDPVCVDCCPCTKHLFWDGKHTAGGTYRRGE